MRKGTLVVVWRDNGEALLTRTRSDATTKSGRSWISVEGIVGLYALEKAVREPMIHPSIIIPEPICLKIRESVSPKDRETLKAALASLREYPGIITADGCEHWKES